MRRLIDQRVIALEEMELSKKGKLKKVLKELGWSNKNIEHFVYGPPKKMTPLVTLR